MKIERSGRPTRATVGSLKQGDTFLDDGGTLFQVTDECAGHDERKCVDLSDGFIHELDFDHDVTPVNAKVVILEG